MRPGGDSLAAAGRVPLRSGIVWHYPAQHQAGEPPVLIPSAVIFLHSQITQEGDRKQALLVLPLELGAVRFLRGVSSFCLIVILRAQGVPWPSQRSRDRDGAHCGPCLLRDCHQEAAPRGEARVLLQGRKAVHDQAEESLGEERVARCLERQVRAAHPVSEG